MKEIIREIKINNEEDTKRFGLEIARNAAPGQVLALIGDLGTGKTTLTKYIAEGLGIKETVTSPTFTIVKEYHGGKLPLYHFDVYRIMDPEEMFEIGVDEYLFGKGISVIEWADQIEEILPDDAMFLFIERGEKEGERIYKCTF